MSARLFVRMMLRSLRGGWVRWLYLLASVALGVTAVVGVGALEQAMERGIRLRARELLGGDLVVESRRPLPPLRPWLPAAQRDAASVQVTLLPTMARSSAGKSRLVELKAIDTSEGAFPLAGTLQLAPDRPLSSLLDDDSALVAPGLFSELGLTVGDTLHVGGIPLRVSGTILREPEPLALTLSLGPRVLITRAALARSKLVGFGSRVRYRTLFRFRGELDARALATLQRELRARVPGGRSHVTVETHTEAQPALRGTMQRVQRYLGLVGLLSLLLASIGVAQGVSAWLREAVLDTAILRCLGLRSLEVFWLYLSQVALLALGGSLLGALLGTMAPLLLARAQPLVLPAELGFALPVRALGHGLLLGLLVPVAMSLPPLLAVWRAPPARVLRSEAAPLPAPPGLRLLLVLVAALALCLAAWWESGDLRTALGFVLAVSALALVCLFAARALLSVLRRLPRAGLHPLVWSGAAALTRPGAGTIGSIIALALGTLVVLSVVLLDTMMQAAVATGLPERAPSVFLLDIQPDQWPDIQATCKRLGATRVDSVPVVMARLSAIDGVSVERLLQSRPGDVNARQREQWVLTREQRISWMDTLPADNQIVAGALWSDPGADEVSLEEGFARELGARLGSVLRFDVQGVPVELKVTSLRTLEWRSFATNFFLVAEPGVLDDAPYFRLGAIRLPEANEQALQDALSAQVPNVTMLRVRGLLERARGMLEQASIAVRVLGLFTVLTGLLLLTGSVAATQQRRAREAALWKALGLSRLRVVTLFAVEYALSGVVAGVLGAGGAYALSLLVARQVLELTSWPSASLCLSAVAVTALLTIVGGLLASFRALLVRPSAVLRG